MSVSVVARLGMLAVLTLGGLAISTPPAAAQLRIQSTCPSIDEDELGSMTASELNCSCFHSEKACAQVGMVPDPDPIDCKNAEFLAAEGRINSQFEDAGAAAEEMVAQSCGAGDIIEPATRPSLAGKYYFERGYDTTWSDAAKAAICDTYYEGEATVARDGTVRFRSGGHSWRGHLDDNLVLTISRDGVTDPEPKNDTWVIGPITEAAMFNGYCGKGWFTMEKL